MIIEKSTEGVFVFTNAIIYGYPTCYDFRHMKVVIGLGNPGKMYQYTRHNVGAKFVEDLAEGAVWKENKAASAKLALNSDNQVLFVLPTTYMNRSGAALTYVKKKYPKIGNEDLFVIHDDLDVALGEYKIQFGKGPHEHNGLLSLYQAWGSSAFWHIRIGIDGRMGSRDVPGQQYVLQPFSPDEVVKLENVALSLIPQVKNQLQQEYTQ